MRNRYRNKHRGFDTEANPNYHTLNYKQDGIWRATNNSYNYVGLHYPITQSRMIASHMDRIHEGTYGWYSKDHEYKDRAVHTGVSKNHRYKPTRTYEIINKKPSVEKHWIKAEDFSNIRNHHRQSYEIEYSYHPPKIKATDIQCIVGTKVLDSDDSYRRDYSLPQSIYDMFGLESMGNVNIDHYSRYNSQPNKVLSVVYISRKDGQLCHDIYYRWCKETQLPFPEDMKHTSEDNDIAWSNAKISPSIKGGNNSDSRLSLFDLCRNKKEFKWTIPFSKLGDSEHLKAYTSTFKSSYKKPSSINTWRKRRERRVHR